jgi:hypothetical protein
VAKVIKGKGICHKRHIAAMAHDCNVAAAANGAELQ